MNPGVSQAREFAGTSADISQERKWQYIKGDPFEEKIPIYCFFILRLDICFQMCPPLCIKTSEKIKKLKKLKKIEKGWRVKQFWKNGKSWKNVQKVEKTKTLKKYKKAERGWKIWKRLKKLPNLKNVEKNWKKIEKIKSS